MPARILIAEDDELQGAVLQSTLERRGHEADIVGDGLEAVRRLRSGSYDLALIDYHLPEVDGLAAAHLLRDVLLEQDRPRLIAVTAAADALHSKEAALGGTPFDAIVAKPDGLAALLAAIDANLASAAELRALAEAQRARERQRRRLLTPLAAVPALAMTAAFLAALGWAAASLCHVDAAAGAAHQAQVLGTNATTLLDAVQDTETSQRAYLAAGSEEQRDAFHAELQRVDRLLASAAPAAAEGAPGLGASGEVQAVVESRMGTLAREAQRRDDAGARTDANAAELAASVEAGRGAAGWLRDWAANLVGGSQRAVSTGLEAAHGHLAYVLAILAAGALYGFWQAFGAARRRWRSVAVPAPVLRTDLRPRPAPAAPRVARAAPAPVLLEHDG